MRKFNYAFSLIELLVVISIIGVLAAIAIPVYARYQYTAKASTIIPIIDGIVTRSIQFSTINQRFGNAFDLGLASTASMGATVWGNSDSSVITKLSPYLATGPNALLVGDVSAGCGKYGIVGGNLNPTALGIPTSLVPDASTIWFECFYWNYNKTINKQCFYSWGSATVAQTSTLIPGWTNLATTTGCCFGNNSVLLSLTSYNNATCQ